MSLPLAIALDSGNGVPRARDFTDLIDWQRYSASSP